MGLALRDVLAASGGRLEGTLAETAVFSRVQLDPGKVEAGDLFVPAPGERVDGHEFVVVAALRGAVAALVSQAWAARVAELPLPLIVVEDDPITALQRLAASRREKLAATVVGITGSVGKTSVKDVVAAVAGQRFTTYRSPGNRNNEIGLPLSVLEIEPSTEVAVLEMGGAFAFGEIALLADIARPEIAVVTNVFPVHLERMGSIEAIAETKAELVDAVPPDGVAVLYGDDSRVAAMAARCAGRVVTYGLSPQNDVWADSIDSRGLDGCSFRLHGEESVEVEVALVGGHAVQLALAAVTVGHVLEMTVSEMLRGLRDPAVQTRLRRLRLPAGALVLDDTYNASPPSVLSGLQLMEEVSAARRIAVLGDMRELGSLSEAEHRSVGRRAGEVVDLLVTYGAEARAMAEEAGPAAVESFDLSQRDELIAFLRSELSHGDVVLVKGSRALRMDEIADALVQSAS